MQRFATRPDLLPPALTIDTRLEGRAPGLVFLAPKSGRGQDGPMIIDDSGHVVWFNAIGNRELASDFRVQSYRGQPVLTWWQGRLIGGEGRGEGKIYDSSYRPIRRVRAGNGFSADTHEFELTSRGTALLLIYDAVRRDLRSVGGSRRGIAVQAVVQEVDIATGLVVFEWHSLGNIGLSESHQRVPRYDGQWDYVHANSVALDAAGDFIVSARHTSAVYRISRRTGRIIWRLGGERSDFRMGAGTRFWNQHDARMQPDGSLTLFDNSAAPPMRRASRAVTLALDTTRMTATLQTALTHPRGLLSATQGGVQKLPNGNTFVGWGSRRYFTEYDASGKVVFDGRFALGGDNYRAYRFEWSGRPARAPALVAERRGNRIAARVSWNGATGVASWELWAGANPQALTRVTGAPSAGFETAVSAVTAGRYVALKALDAGGAVIGSSAAIKPPSSRPTLVVVLPPDWSFDDPCERGHCWRWTFRPRLAACRSRELPRTSTARCSARATRPDRELEPRRRADVRLRRGRGRRQFDRARRPEDVDELRSSRASPGASRWSAQMVRLTREGKQIEVSLTLSPVRDADGAVVAIGEIARDIGAQGARARPPAVAEAGLGGPARGRHRARLQQPHDRRDRVRGAVRSTRVAEGNPVRKYVEETKRAGERATELTQQLLAFGRRQTLRPDRWTSTRSWSRWRRLRG